MMHRQLRNALEEIFGETFIASALRQSELGQLAILERREEFKETVRGFQRLNYRDEQQRFATITDSELSIALVCSLLDQETRELVAELGLSYL
jgi:hypothetical protein